MGLDLDLGFQNTHSLNIAVGVSAWYLGPNRGQRSCSGPSPHPSPFRSDPPHHDAYPLVVAISVRHHRLRWRWN